METKEGDDTLNKAVPDEVEIADNFVPILSILDGIKEKAGNNTTVYYAKGCDVIGDNRDGFAEAINIAKKSDIAVIVVGDKSGLVDDCTSGETRDRADLNLPGVQEDLIKAISKTGVPVLVVLVNGRPLSINWAAGNVPAIIEAWLPGEEGARAIADVLFGDYNPGGKLPMSFPRGVGQVPVYYNHKPSGGRSHWKGDYVEMGTKPLFPFGFGLSYTNFEYSNLIITPETISHEGEVQISIDVENTGSCRGDEVVQLYINDMQSEVTRPVKELKNFKRVTLEPAQKKTVVFTLYTGQLGFYNKEIKYVIEPGDIKVMVGSSSEDIRLTGLLKITGSVIEIGNNKKYLSTALVR